MPIGKTPSPYGVQQPYALSGLLAVTNIPTQTNVNPPPPSGGVSTVTGTAPIASSGGTAPDISLANSGATAGTYGDAGNVGQFTVDAHGLITAAVNVPMSAGTSAANLWQYRAKTTATSGYPGDGYMLWNNATQTSATSLILAHLTNDDLDIDVFLATVAIGNTLLLQDANNSDNNQKWTVSGTPTQTNGGTATSYWTFPVTLVSSAGTGTTGFPNNHQLVVFRFANPYLTNAHLFVGNASNVPTDVAASGDVTLANTGAFTVAKINGATLGTTTATDKNILIANGTQWNTEPLSGDATITNAGVLTIANAAVTNAKLANMAAHTVKANITGSAAAPVDSSLSAILDAEISSTQGTLLYRGASAWAGLGPGSGGYILVSNGAGANPSWQPGGGITSNWATIVDLDFSALSNQTLGTDTTFTVGTDVNGNNLTWTKANSTNDSVAMAIVNGSGLVIQPKTTGTYLDTTRTATSLSLDLPSVISNYYIGMPIQVWIHISADNITNNSEGIGIAIDNIGGSTAVECQVFMVRFKNGSGIKCTRYTGNGLNAVVALNDPTANLDNTDRVMMMSFPLGRFNGNALFAKGAYSSGWPAYSALIPFGRTTSASTAANLGLSADLVTGLPMKLVIYGQSNTTAKSYTVAHLRIDYQVR